MSVSENYLLTCPGCAAQSQHSVLVSIDGGRSPAHREQVLTGTLNRLTCPTCQYRTRAPVPVMYIDMDARHFVGCFPHGWEHSWPTLERKVVDIWRRTRAQFGDPDAVDQPDDYQVRAVFGVSALREKLLCFDHGLDDATLEVFKLDLMRCQDNELMVHPASRPLLVEVGEHQLGFNASVPNSPHSTGNGRTTLSNASIDVILLRVPRERLDRLGNARAQWFFATGHLSGAPYVDIGRIMLDGEEDWERAQTTPARHQSLAG